jgi:hypothetical protein
LRKVSSKHPDGTQKITSVCTTSLAQHAHIAAIKTCTESPDCKLLLVPQMHAAALLFFTLLLLLLLAVQHR